MTNPTPHDGNAEPGAQAEPDIIHGSFAGKVGVITGGSQGLGEATARLMARRGAVGIVIAGRDRGRGEAVAASLDCEAEFVTGDLADADTPAAILRTADKKFGRVDTIVNAAALTVRGSVWDTTAELWDKMLFINTRAPGLMMSAAAHIMKREGIEGTMVNVGSVASYGGTDFLYPYAASKMALQAMTKNAAFTLMRHRIRVNLIQPGWMATPGENTIQRTFHGAEDGWLAQAATEQPFGRLIDPDEVARAICFLASSESGLMTGSVIDFDQTVQGAGDAPKPNLLPTWGEEA